MKLAEALALRADITKKIDSLRARVGRCALVQEGLKPPENAEVLLKEAMGAIGELKILLVRINKTNTMGTLADGRTLTEAVAERDALISQHSFLQHSIDSTQREKDRYSNSEILWVPQLDVGPLHKQLDDVAKKIRLTNLAIQQANWDIDLV
jgi:hypothetical protein